MPSIETVLACPLGADCETVKDGKIYRCRWFVRMKGKDAAGDDHDEDLCAIAWMPILQTEMSGQVIQTNASLQSLRNQNDIRQKEAIEALEKYDA